MKIRQGFVSNSSSSSFAILCQPIEFDKIKSLKNIHVVGDYLEEGEDYFSLTKEIFDYMKKHKDDETLKLDFGFYKVFAETFDGENEIKKSSLPSKFFIKTMIVEQSSTDSLDSFIENYVKSCTEVKNEN